MARKKKEPLLKVDDKLVLTIFGKIFTKQRPRFNSNTKSAYMSSNYTEFKATMVEHFKEQWKYQVPCERARLSFFFFGSHLGDPDNLAGSLLDCLVQAKILEDDKMMKNTSGFFVYPFPDYAGENGFKLKTIIKISKLEFLEYPTLKLQP